MKGRRLWLASACALSMLGVACTIWNDVTLPTGQAFGRDASLDAQEDAFAESPYAAEVRAATPIAYWRFTEIASDQGGRVVRDESGHGHDCTASAGATIEAGPLAAGSAIHLGANDALQCSGDAAFAFAKLSPFTFEAFVLHDGPDGPRGQDEYRQVIDRMAGGNPSDRLGYYAFFSRKASSDTWSFGLEQWRGNSVGLPVSTSSSAELAAGTWAHFAVTQEESGKLVLYLNGIPRSEATALAMTPSPNVQLIFGGNQNRSCCALVGKIAEMAVYGRALDAATVRRHYQTAYPQSP